MSKRIVIDTETSNPSLNITDTGAFKYIRDPLTKVICLCWQVIDGPSGDWYIGDPAPEALFNELPGSALWAHNSIFEQLVWEHHLAPAGWPQLCSPIQCTMAVAGYRALPMGLDDLAAVLIPNGPRKSKLGKMLVNFLNPGGKKLTKRERKALCLSFGVDTPTVESLRPAILDYCRQDVAVTAEVLKLLGGLPENEQRVFELDRRINYRGLPIDLPAIRGAAAVASYLQEVNNALMTELTGGEVTACSQAVGITKWANIRLPADKALTDLSAGTVSAALASADLPPEVRQGLELRQKYGSAVKKLNRLMQCASEDGRVRGLLQYHGASTGRWAGRLVQPQNLPRPTVPPDRRVPIELFRGVEENPADFAEFLTAVSGSAEEMVKTAIRGMFCAPEGQEFVWADFSGIESRVLAILAGEEWKVKLFRDLDAGTGKDNYLKAADIIYGYECTSKETHPAERQTGKIAELALGYQGSLGAWRNFDSSDRFTDDEVRGHIRAWRDGHPKTVGFWRACDDAAVLAVMSGRPSRAGTVTFETVEGYLTILLPSDRRLWYWAPSVEEGTYGPRVEVSRMRQIGTGQRHWCRVPLYGGSIVENIVQAVARDLMVDAMFDAEARGLEIVLTVHDELVVLAPVERAKEFKKDLVACMTNLPVWAAGWPISAEGASGQRYAK